MNPFIRLKQTTSVFLIAFGLACLALSPTARAQLSPAPDGGYPNGNTAEGDGALSSNLLGGLGGNTAVGNGALGSGQFGSRNTAIGYQALANNQGDFNDVDGVFNTATGSLALSSNTIGYDNTANGEEALVNNTTGHDNIAIGSVALFTNTTGGANTAIGFAALNQNNGSFNTASGATALESNTTGNHNTATGVHALISNTTASGNTANGFSAAFHNTSGNSNTAEGNQALFHNTTGTGNIALGSFAGGNLTTGSNNIDIGIAGVAGESNTIRIGSPQTRTFIKGIRGVTTANANAIPVVIDAAGQLGTMSSSKRFKKEIKPMDSDSEAVLGLKPVTFRYKCDRTDTPQFGLIAEEVAEVNPDLVMRDENGDIYTVRYDAVNAMLLNEFLKEHRTVEEQGAIIAKLQKQIEALTKGLQKVSAQVELKTPAPQTVVNNQ